MISKCPGATNLAVSRTNESNNVTTFTPAMRNILHTPPNKLHTVTYHFTLKYYDVLQTPHLELTRQFHMLTLALLFTRHIGFSASSAFLPLSKLHRKLSSSVTLQDPATDSGQWFGL